MKAIPAIAAFLLAAAPAIAHAETVDAIARIAAYDEAVVAVMKQKGTLQARADRFESVVREYYDMPAIAQIVIGQKWGAAGAADRDAALAALTRHCAVTLARHLGAYRGEKFTVDPQVVSRGASRIIRVELASPDSHDVLFYQLREGAGGLRIVDVISDGVSQLASQRAEFAATVTMGGAAGLAQRLARVDAAAR